MKKYTVELVEGYSGVDHLVRNLLPQTADTVREARDIVRSVRTVGGSAEPRIDIVTRGRRWQWE